MTVDNKLFPAVYAAELAKTIAVEQAKLTFMPDWWQQVVAQLHSQLDKQFPQFEVEFEELTATDVIPPWKGGSAPAEQPDFLRLQKMAPTRMNLLEWRQNGFEQRLGELEARAAWVPADVIPPYKGRPDDECPVCGEPEDKPHAPDCEYAVLDSLHLAGMENSRLNAMDWRFNGIEERLGTLETDANPFRLNGMDRRLVALEDWADIRYLPSEADDCVANTDIHELIAEGMTGVTADMQKTIDRLTGRIDEIQDLLLKAVLKVDALETKAPC
jgi:hypothetical protein